MIARWNSLAFLSYIEKQVMQFSEGVSKRMLHMIPPSMSRQTPPPQLNLAAKILQALPRITNRKLFVINLARADRVKATSNS
eukprot:scaffold958_cov128-Skeletonema_dohrnii-CCMP3373.AAC.14